MMANESQIDHGKVAVLMGGWSAEREISLKSGNAVLNALLESGVTAVGIDVDDTVSQKLTDGQFDKAFIALHGRGGEDGSIQGLLETMKIPYTGSGVLGSALALDKMRSKQVWLSMNLATPDFMLVENTDDCKAAVSDLGLPLIVKPVLEGSSIGMSKVETDEQMIPAFEKAKQNASCVIAERWVAGNEYTAAIVGRSVLPLIKLETSREFYDYVAKYESDDTKYICPCGLDESIEAELAEFSLKAFDAVGASGWGRVDFMVDESAKAWLIEVNTIPGMTDHSLVPMAAKQKGMDFNELVLEILGGSNE